MALLPYAELAYNGSASPLNPESTVGNIVIGSDVWRKSVTVQIVCAHTGTEPSLLD